MELSIELDPGEIVETIKKYGRATISVSQEDTGTIIAKIEETGKTVGRAKTIFFPN